MKFLNLGYHNCKMRKFYSIIASTAFLFLAPGFVTGWMPWMLSDHWKMSHPFEYYMPLRMAGIILLLPGIIALVDSVGRFALQGLGTPAPVMPTRHLVVTGLYCYVRNPMYVAVTFLIIGQGLLFANMSIIEYGLIIIILFDLFVRIYEEPKLRKSFGEEYKTYCKNVRRWIPRLRAWRNRQ